MTMSSLSVLLRKKYNTFSGLLTLHLSLLSIRTDLRSIVPILEVVSFFKNHPLLSKKTFSKLTIVKSF